MEGAGNQTSLAVAGVGTIGWQSAVWWGNRTVIDPTQALRSE
jgi:hypothetical protein